MHKKGSIFTIILDFFLIAALIFGIISITQAFGDFKEASKIGDKQFALIDRYQEASLLESPLSVGVNLAAQSTLLDLANFSGADCPLYKGYPVLSLNCKTTPEPLFDRLMQEEHKEYRNKLSFPVPLYHYVWNDNILYAAARDLIASGSLPKVNTGATTADKIVYIVDHYADQITAQSSVVSPGLIGAVMLQESGGNPYAVSPTGCIGLMQLCYSTAEGYPAIFTKLKRCGDCWKSQTCHLPNQCASFPALDDRFNPDKSIEAGALLLKSLVDEFAGKTDAEKFALAAYNGGSQAVKNAIAATGKSDPSWEEVSSAMTINHLKSISSYSTWTDQQLEEKVSEITDYVAKVEHYAEFVEVWEVSV